MNKQEQIETFKHMLTKLENEGKCMYKFHKLGFELFGEVWNEYDDSMTHNRKDKDDES